MIGQNSVTRFVRLKVAVHGGLTSPSPPKTPVRILLTRTLPRQYAATQLHTYDTSFLLPPLTEPCTYNYINTSAQDYKVIFASLPGTGTCAHYINISLHCIAIS